MEWGLMWELSLLILVTLQAGKKRKPPETLTVIRGWEREESLSVNCGDSCGNHCGNHRGGHLGTSPLGITPKELKTRGHASSSVTPTLLLNRLHKYQHLWFL